MNIDEFYSGAKDDIALFDAFSAKHSLVGTAAADHICYKCESAESYDRMRAMIEPESEYIYQSYISGRRIATIKLKRGFETSLGTIYFLELSDQKPDGSQREGFDHIEVFPTEGSYDEFVKKFAVSEKVVHVARPHHTTDDIELSDTFLFRCTPGPLIEKIKASQMS